MKPEPEYCKQVKDYCKEHPGRYTVKDVAAKLSLSYAQACYALDKLAQNEWWVSKVRLSSYQTYYDVKSICNF
jgi:hypothetical protein